MWRIIRASGHVRTRGEHEPIRRIKLSIPTCDNELVHGLESHEMELVTVDVVHELVQTRQVGKQVIHSVDPDQVQLVLECVHPLVYIDWCAPWVTVSTHVAEEDIQFASIRNGRRVRRRGLSHMLTITHQLLDAYMHYEMIVVQPR